MVDFDTMIKEDGVYICQFEPYPGVFPYKDVSFIVLGDELYYYRNAPYTTLLLTEEYLKYWRSWKEYFDVTGKKQPLLYKQVYRREKMSTM